MEPSLALDFDTGPAGGTVATHAFTSRGRRTGGHMGVLAGCSGKPRRGPQSRANRDRQSVLAALFEKRVPRPQALCLVLRGVGGFYQLFRFDAVLRTGCNTNAGAHADREHADPARGRKPDRFLASGIGGQRAYTAPGIAGGVPGA